MERYLRDTPTTPAPTEKTLLENWQIIRQQYPIVGKDVIKKIILVKQADNEQPVDKTLLSEVELLIEMKTDDQKKSLLR